MTAEPEGGTALQIGDIVHDARWFPEHFDARSGEFGFVAAGRDALSEQAFLDARWDRAQRERKRTSIAALLPLPQQPPRPNFIWHTGFCCSTLLAKALDRRGHNLSLCEPQILVEVADAKRAGILASSPHAPQLAFHLLSRSFRPGERITLKPAPAANYLIREAAALTSGPMLFLYSDCRSYLVSIAKMGEEGRRYARRMFLALLGDGHVQAQWPVDRLLSFSDLEMAAIVWHMQVAEFVRNWPQLGATRAFSLDCDSFLASPGAVLSRLDEVFSLGLGGEHIEQLPSSPLFERNAKSTERDYNHITRQEERRLVELQLGNDLDRIVRQSYSLCRTTPQGPPLPNALVTIDKIYC